LGLGVTILFIKQKLLNQGLIGSYPLQSKRVLFYSPIIIFFEITPIMFFFSSSFYHLPNFFSNTGGVKYTTKKNYKGVISKNKLQEGIIKFVYFAGGESLLTLKSDKIILNTSFFLKTHLRLQVWGKKKPRLGHPFEILENTQSVIVRAPGPFFTHLVSYPDNIYLTIFSIPF
jgi:hypothetical protein